LNIDKKDLRMNDAPDDSGARRAGLGSVSRRFGDDLLGDGAGGAILVEHLGDRLGPAAGR
jgi:hypothetical protein